MKKYITLLLFCLLITQVNAQPGNCRNAMPESLFRQKYNAIMMQNTDSRKLEMANDLAVSVCLSADQVKSIAALFIDDFSRLEFAKTAYRNTVDKENYYFVYDEFAYISTVFMLHDYIGGIQQHPHDYLPPSEPPLNLNFAALDYPDVMSYRGPTNCAGALAEVDFIKLARQYAFNENEQARLMLFTQMVQNNCMSVAQVMKLASLLTNENNRLTFFRAAKPSIFDLGNLSFGVQLFSHIPNRAAYNDLIAMPTDVPIVVPACQVTREEFADMLQSIKKESFNSTKLTLAKNIIKSRPCFSTGQVRDIVNEFSFESGKLEIAKFAYDYTVDKANYYRIADAFTFSSSKEDLMKFIESKR
jgi:hypothetical protein